jgi:hypothetical protein
MIPSPGTNLPVVHEQASFPPGGEVSSSQFAGQGEPPTEMGSKLVEVVGKIVALSQRLFPGPVTIDYSYDPENPSDEYLVFDVVAQGQYADYRDREFQWHEEVEKIVPGSLGDFRLCVMPQR